MPDRQRNGGVDLILINKNKAPKLNTTAPIALSFYMDLILAQDSRNIHYFVEARENMSDWSAMFVLLGCDPATALRFTRNRPPKALAFMLQLYARKNPILIERKVSTKDVN
jgi:hypothetical protein